MVTFTTCYLLYVFTNQSWAEPLHTAGVSLKMPPAPLTLSLFPCLCSSLALSSCWLRGPAAVLSSIFPYLTLSLCRSSNPAEPLKVKPSEIWNTNLLGHVDVQSCFVELGEFTCFWFDLIFPLIWGFILLELLRLTMPKYKCTLFMYD